MDREGGGDLFGSSYPGAEGPCKGVTSRQGKDCSTRRPFLRTALICTTLCESYLRQSFHGCRQSQILSHLGRREDEKNNGELETETSTSQIEIVMCVTYFG